MLKRHIDSVLDSHYASTRKALLLTGARQTVKTYAIRAFAQRAGLQLVELNFILQPETRLIPQGLFHKVLLMCRICCCVSLLTRISPWNPVKRSFSLMRYKITRIS